MSDETRGLWLGFLGVAIFAMTAPMTRLAGGTSEDPQLAPQFVMAGRAVLAALCSVAWLALIRAPLPQRRDAGALVTTAAGVVIGFPLFLGLAVREVEAMHAAVVTGVLPLATAAFGALLLGQRPSRGFWAAALAGTVLVLAFAWIEGGGFRVADLLLLLAVASASIGYVVGARLTGRLGAEQVICWVLVISLPATVPVMLMWWPEAPVRVSAWLGFGYVALFSMWLGFFAWYRGLAIGGTVRVSQVQLVQPFLSLLFAVPLLGEVLTPSTLGFALAVIATVLIGRRMPVDRARSRKE